MLFTPKAKVQQATLHLQEGADVLFRDVSIIKMEEVDRIIGLYKRLKSRQLLFEGMRGNPLLFLLTAPRAYAHCTQCMEWKIDVKETSAHYRMKYADEANKVKPTGNHNVNRARGGIDSSAAPSNHNTGPGFRGLHLCSKCGKEHCGVDGEVPSLLVEVQEEWSPPTVDDDQSAIHVTRSDSSRSREELDETSSSVSSIFEEAESLVESIEQTMDHLTRRLGDNDLGGTSPSSESPGAQSTGAGRSTKRWKLVFRPNPDATQPANGQTGVQGETLFTIKSTVI